MVSSPDDTLGTGFIYVALAGPSVEDDTLGLGGRIVEVSKSRLQRSPGYYDVRAGGGRIEALATDGDTVYAAVYVTITGPPSPLAPLTRTVALFSIGVFARAPSLTLSCPLLFDLFVNCHNFQTVTVLIRPSLFDCARVRAHATPCLA